MEILPISKVELDNLIRQLVLNYVGRSVLGVVDHFEYDGMRVLDVARQKCREIVEVMKEIYRGRNSMDELLKKAAIQGDVVFLREAVASNKPNAYFQSLHCMPDPNYRKDRVGNMFHLAAWNKREEFLREAMEILPKVNIHFLLCQQDHPNFKRNPLHVAAGQGYNKIVKVILDYCDHHKSLTSAPANSLPQPTKAMAMGMDCRSVKPWLDKDIWGNTPFYYVMERCREECALQLSSMDSEMFSHMDDCGKDDAYYSIFVIALRRGFSKVILKFWESAPNWHTFDKRVLACAIGPMPNCSDEIVRLVLEQNLQRFYRMWPPLASWALIGKLYPFEYALKEEVCATDLRRYIVGMISEENPLYYVAGNPIFGKERECPKLGPPPVELKRGRPPSERRRDKTKKRKVYTRTNTLRCCKCKQFGHNSRSHRENNVLQMRRGKDKPRKPKVGEKRRVGRPSKVDENTLKEVKTTEGTSSQPTTGTPSSS
ncbi:hypothetical protein Cgig2_000248 [Carnegiea gigantea]|uniref:Uncharacterized protein n=1 Tax=Carnegiea gigantea TaxID=171969 RepID=A0A9Q1JFB3_9CARY|nr:hypothetical protein Cgig2_000248 [Carnegiea gigantea]